MRHSVYITSFLTILVSAYFPGLYLICLGAALGLCGLLMEDKNDNKGLY